MKSQEIQNKRYREKAEVRFIRSLMLQTGAEYGLEGLDERYENKLRALNEIAKTAPDAFPQAAQKVRDGFQIHVLALWAKGEIRGPLTRSYFEKRIKNAESLAKMFAKKGDKSGQKKAIARMKEIQGEYKAAEASGNLRA